MVLGKGLKLEHCKHCLCLLVISIADMVFGKQAEEGSGWELSFLKLAHIVHIIVCIHAFSQQQRYFAPCSV